MFHAWCLSPEDPQLVAYPARPGLSPAMINSARSAAFAFLHAASPKFNGPTVSYVNVHHTWPDV
jgi:hypothetical protein